MGAQLVFSGIPEKVSARELEALKRAEKSCGQIGRMVTSYEMYGNQHRKRGKELQLLKSLESKGLVARSGYQWSTGRVTEKGKFLLRHATAFVIPSRKANTFPQGISKDGGTKYKQQLFRADEGSIVALGRQNPKLGDVVSKGRHKDLRMYAITLEEGRTCPMACQLRDRCYGGGMNRAARLLWEGEKTGVAVAHAMRAEKNAMFRLHTLGDFPSELYVVRTLLAVLDTSRNAAFGFTHHPPESEIGKMIRNASKEHWDRFAIRTSYLHGSRAPIKERSAVVISSPEQAKEHNAVWCPEQQGKVKDCASCGYCWHTKRPVAFLLHSKKKEL